MKICDLAVRCRSLGSAVLLSACIFAGPGAATFSDAAELDLSGLADLSQRAAFQQFTAELWPAARAKGVSRRVFDRAMTGLAPDPKVIELAGNQPEFNTTIWAYIAKTVNNTRIEKGRAMGAQHDRLFRTIERRHGVDRHVILSIWGMETNYGGSKGKMSTVRSLATLGFTGRRQKFGRKQLLAALQILQNEDISPEHMTGSWAGAMGHTQFIPTTYNAYAVDWDGDGRRDIWNSIGDAAASTASYLRKSGWTNDRPWGWEVRLPKDFNFDRAGRANRRSVAEWVRLGLRPARGGRFGAAGAGSWVILPAGAKGPAFLVTDNFKAILRYNNSTAYALSVGHLADRLRGGGPLIGSWPKDDPQLSRSQRNELQSLLSKEGLHRS